MHIFVYLFSLSIYIFSLFILYIHTYICIYTICCLVFSFLCWCFSGFGLCVLCQVSGLGLGRLVFWFDASFGCSSIPQLPFKRPQIPSNRDHMALNRGTFGGLGPLSSHVWLTASGLRLSEASAFGLTSVARASWLSLRNPLKRAVVRSLQ